LSPGKTASTDAILTDARGRLAGYKLPREIRVVDQVPRAPNGKANYPAARELFG
jgi:fatty-acyl-CoA synthase